MKSLIIFLLLSSQLFALLKLNDVPTYKNFNGKVWSDKSIKYLKDPNIRYELPTFLYNLALKEGKTMVWKDKLYIGTGYYNLDNSNTLHALLSYKRALIVYSKSQNINCLNDENIIWNNKTNLPTCKCPVKKIQSVSATCLSYDYNSCSCSCEATGHDFVNINGTSKCLKKCQNDELRDTNGICVKKSVSDFLKPPDYCKSYTGSYVIPYTHSFHDDKAITGSDLTLHYTNIYTKGFNNAEENITSKNPHKNLLASGWNINVHHHLQNNILFKGDGEYIKDVNTTLVDGLIKIKDNDLLYIFNSNQKHIKTKHILSNITLYEFFYDNDKLTSIKDADSKTIFIHYKNGKLASIQTNSGQSTIIKTNHDNTISSITYPNDQTYKFIYDKNALMIKKYDPKGNMYKYRYRSNTGYIRSAIKPQKDLLVYSYTSFNDIQKNILATFENGKILKTHYINHKAKNGIKHSSVKYPNDTLKNIYTNVNGKERQSDFCGIKTTQKHELIHPKTLKPLLTYLSYKMPSGLEYKEFLHTSFLNNVQTQKKLIKNSISKTITDFTNHEVTHISPLGYKSKYTYDDKMLNITKIKPPFSLPIFYKYDQRGNLISKTRGKRVKYFNYDIYDNLISTKTDDNDAITYQYDNSNRLINITYPDNSRIDYEYDLNGNIIKLFTPSLSPNIYTHNSINQKTSHESPTGYKTKYTYDRSTHLTSITKPSLKSIKYQYKYKNLVSIDDGEYNTTISYTCNQNPKKISSTSGEELSFGYDGDLLLSQNYKGILNKSILYTYNDKFLPISIKYAGLKENIIYDKDDKIIAINSVNISYHEQNQTLQDGNFNSQIALSKYDELKSINNTYSNNKIYSYVVNKRDNKGKILNAHEYINDEKIEYAYTYNNKSQLTKAIMSINNLPAHEENYSYDEAGNKISTTIKNNQGTKTINSSFLNNSIQTHGDISYIYDEDGYLKTKITSDDRLDYTYGIYGELKKVTSKDKTIEYLHNANHQRVAKKVNGVITQKYLWKDLTTLLAIYDKDDKLITRYFYANAKTPYKIIHHGITYYPNYNHQGSLISLIDKNNNIVKKLRYSPYGKILYDSNSSLNIHKTFANGLYDEDTKLIRFGKRDYDSQTGTWTALDPIEFKGGDSNLYRYVFNDPVNFIDPRGEFWQVVVIGAVSISAYLLIKQVIKAKKATQKSKNDSTNLSNSIRNPNKFSENYSKWSKSYVNAAKQCAKIAQHVPNTTATGLLPMNSKDLVINATIGVATNED